jgi:hypothetical protein
MDFVLELKEAGKERYKANKYIAPSCNSGWAKLDTYYSKTVNSPAYTAAVVLNPSNIWQALEANWGSKWIPPAKRA